MIVSSPPTNFLNAKFLIDNKVRELSILDEGLEFDTTDFKKNPVKKIRVNVRCNDSSKTEKLWEMNKPCQKSLVTLFGVDTKNWIGKIVKVNFELYNGHQMIKIDEMDTESLNKAGSQKQL